MVLMSVFLSPSSECKTRVCPLLARLSVVRDLVIAQGGRVWVEQARGGGARFVVTFPADKQPSGVPTSEPVGALT